MGGDVAEGQAELPGARSSSTPSSPRLECKEGWHWAGSVRRCRARTAGGAASRAECGACWVNTVDWMRTVQAAAGGAASRAECGVCRSRYGLDVPGSPGRVCSLSVWCTLYSIACEDEGVCR